MISVRSLQFECYKRKSFNLCFLLPTRVCMCVSNCFCLCNIMYDSLFIFLDVFDAVLFDNIEQDNLLVVEQLLEAKPMSELQL